MENNKKMDQIVGASFEELNTEDMKQVQGAGDVEAETAVVSVTLFYKGNGNGNGKAPSNPISAMVVV
ncbi:MAG: lichenicidin A2 family type 2 lantibiotic [Butyrivibrio sp.]|nr:lichenicidin A2 family type 2 lantibiotic [Butyrivibrio sp.]